MQTGLLGFLADVSGSGHMTCHFSWHKDDTSLNQDSSLDWQQGDGKYFSLKQVIYRTFINKKKCSLVPVLIFTRVLFSHLFIKSASVKASGLEFILWILGADIWWDFSIISAQRHILTLIYTPDLARFWEKPKGNPCTQTCIITKPYVNMSEF